LSRQIGLGGVDDARALSLGHACGNSQKGYQSEASL
jgi:hypothetical protein